MRTGSVCGLSAGCLPSRHPPEVKVKPRPNPDDDDDDDDGDKQAGSESYCKLTSGVKVRSYRLRNITFDDSVQSAAVYA